MLAAVGKTVRMGLEAYDPTVPLDCRETNGAWILRELQDLKQAIAILEEELTREGYTAPTVGT